MKALFTVLEVDEKPNADLVSLGLDAGKVVASSDVLDGSARFSVLVKELKDRFVAGDTVVVTLERKTPVLVDVPQEEPSQFAAPVPEDGPALSEAEAPIQTPPADPVQPSPDPVLYPDDAKAPTPAPESEPAPEAEGQHDEQPQPQV